MAAKAKESNQALVIVLVFFILTTIGLGVATYYGFAEQEKLRGDKKTAEDNKKKADTERDFFLSAEAAQEYGLVDRVISSH